MSAKIFICYAREDERFLNKLKKQLSLLQHQGLIELWYDRNISAGSEWEKEIHEHLSSADVILLLVSPHFMASQYCYGVEMKQALERQEEGDAVVIPIILRPVDWESTPLSKLQALPTDGKPMTTWAVEDKALLDIVKGIRGVVEKRVSQAEEMKEAQNNASFPEEKQDIQHQSLFHNEEDMKIKLVVEYLKALGFDQSELSFERSFFLKMGKFSYKVETEQQIDAAQARLDILVSRAGKNLFIVEIKNTNISISSADIDQAVSYARLVHPIAPICIITNGKEWKCIDSITKEDISDKDIITIANYEPTLPQEAYYEAAQHFFGYSRKNLLQFFQQQVPDAMKNLRGSETDRTKKYIGAVYEPRERLDTIFSHFVQSDARCFVVVGDSGSGKTCWVCDTALKYLQSHQTVLFYRACDIEKGIFREISADLNWALSPHYDEVQAMKRLQEALRDDRVLVFIDGLDEIPGDLARKVTNEFLKRVDGRHLKLITTCKTAAWEDLLEHDGIPTHLSHDVFTVERSKGYLLRNFDDQEFTSVVQKYRAFYQYSGGFNMEVYENCRHDPFLLRIMFEVASKGNLPSISYTAIDFFQEYFFQLSKRFETAQRNTIQYIHYLCGFVVKRA